MSYESNEAIKGSKSNPYTQEEVEELLNHKAWHGGWVHDSQTNGVLYLRSDLGTEQDGRYPLGSNDNPFSSAAYEEMMALEIWPGGWVREHGELVYHRAFGDTSGSGSAYGGGCGGDSGGSGSGLIAGSGRFRPIDVSAELDILVTWGDGSFLNGQNPPVSAMLCLGGASSGASLPACWDGSYHVKITYNGFLYYNIPGQYRY